MASKRNASIFRIGATIETSSYIRQLAWADYIKRHKKDPSIGGETAREKWYWRMIDSLPAEIKLTQVDYNDLSYINSEVNKMPYVRDSSQYGEPEYWQSGPGLITGGDCEDFALEKRRRLIEIGFPWQQLRICIIKVYDIYGKYIGRHAVLIARTVNGDFVLDLGNNAVNPINSYDIGGMWQIESMQDEVCNFRVFTVIKHA